jgi:hypothetical protein
VGEIPTDEDKNHLSERRAACRNVPAHGIRGKEGLCLRKKPELRGSS